MLKVVLATTSMLALLVATAPAGAVLQLSADIGGTLFNCIDNAACDTNATPGNLQIGNQTIAGVQINGSIQTSTQGAGFNQIDTSSLSIINTNAVPTGITLTVGDINFVGPVDTYTVSGSGTFQGPTGNQLTMNWFNDPNNAQGGDAPDDTPGDLIDTFSATQTLARSQSFAYNNTGSVFDPALFSMTIQTIGTLQPGGSLLSRGQTETKELLAVPEPGSLALLGASLLGLGLLRRRGRVR